tara:strand:+ start:909 stop:2066 length:1158 start_codon:yes stop_codon:yes gene_type:complete
MIPYAKQSIDKQDIKEVVSVLKSEMITQGPVVPRFEKLISSYVSSKYAIATNSATSALHIACLSLELEKNDILWTVGNTFVSTANCAIHCGSSVDFVDINLNTYNICIDSLEDKLRLAKKINKLPKILICVHYAGQSPEMKKIYLLKKQFGFKIIEDASHAIGAKYLEKHVGSCQFSDITIFSFHPVKIITTGEGGMALTNKKKLADRMRLLRSHGITRDKNQITGTKSSEIWNYQQILLGFNYRLTDIQAALGCSQFKKIEKFLNKRRAIADKYDKSFKKTQFLIPWQDPNTSSSYHLYPLKLKEDKQKKSQKSLYNKLHKFGIGVNLHYIPVYLHPYYKKLGFKRGYCPNTEDFFKKTLSLPIFPDLKINQQKHIIDCLIKIM